MRLTAILIAVMLAASSAYSQNPASDTKAQQPASHEGYEAEIIHIKTLTGDSFTRLLNMLSVFDAKIRGDEDLRTIVVYAPKDVVVQMRRIVAELDSPGSEAAIGRNIEMTLTLLRCSTKPQSATKLPDDIEPVAKQLRAATQYKDIQLWDVIPLRLQEGKITTTELQLTIAGDSRSTGLKITMNTEAAARRETSWSVRFKQVRLDFSFPLMEQVYLEGRIISRPTVQVVGINTAGDFLEGQKTVIGKVSGAENESAVFAVISLKVLE